MPTHVLADGSPSGLALFRVLGDPTRARVATLLASGERACVCELCDALGEPQYNVSRHLKVLVQVGLLRRVRDGRWVYYRLAPAAARFGSKLIAFLRALPDHDRQLAADRRRFFARLKLRRDGRCCVWRASVSEGAPAS